MTVILLFGSGIPEDYIIKIKWEGSSQLEMVLFDCDWFDPTPSGTRRTEKLGLLEIKHAARLSVFEPFVMASQVKQVNYLPYACKSRIDLQEWWVTYQVTPRGYIPPDDNDSNPLAGTVQEELFFQEDGLEGTFVIDLNIELDNTTPVGSDEISDPKDLEFLSKLNAEGYVEEALDGEEIYEEDEDGQDEECQDDLPADPTYHPNDY